MANEMITTRVRLPLALPVFLLVWLFVTPFAFADDTATQQKFSTPDAAVTALVAADKADDMKAMSSILGPDADQLLSSGDPVADKNARDEFARRYDEMHRLAYDDQGRVILYIGAENWPVPIPLTKKDSGWVFDTAAGKDELLFRRIGRNELFTIKVLEDLAVAQSEYASEAHDGGREGEFAQKILSDSGEAQRVVLGDRRRTARESYRTTRRESHRSRLQEGYWRESYSIPRVLLQSTDEARQECSRRCQELFARWQNDQGVRIPRLSRRVSRFGSCNIHDQSGWRHRPKGSWTRHRKIGERNLRIQSRQDLG